MNTNTCTEIMKQQQTTCNGDKPALTKNKVKTRRNRPGKYARAAFKTALPFHSEDIIPQSGVFKHTITCYKCDKLVEYEPNPDCWACLSSNIPFTHSPPHCCGYLTGEYWCNECIEAQETHHVDDEDINDLNNRIDEWALYQAFGWETPNQPRAQIKTKAEKQIENDKNTKTIKNSENTKTDVELTHTTSTPRPIVQARRRRPKSCDVHPQSGHDNIRPGIHKPDGNLMRYLRNAEKACADRKLRLPPKPRAPKAHETKSSQTARKLKDIQIRLARQLKNTIEPQSGWLSVGVDPEAMDVLRNISQTLDHVAGNGINVKHNFGLDGMLGGFLKGLQSALSNDKVQFLILLAVAMGLYNSEYISAKPIVALIVGYLMLKFAEYMPMFMGFFKGPDMVVLMQDVVAEEDDIEPQGANSTHSFVDAFMMVIYGFAFKKVAQKKDMKVFHEFMAAIPRTKDGIEFSVEWLLQLVVKFSVFLKKTFGWDSCLLKLDQHPEITSYASEVDVLIEDINKGAPLNYANGMRVYALQKKGSDLLRAIPKGREFDEGRALLSNVMSYMNPIKARLDRANITGNGPRIEPLGVLIGGPTDVGKSTMSAYILLQVMAAILPVEDLASFRANHNDYIYNRTCTTFFDGYHGQFSFNYDDVGQEVDVAGNPENVYNEIIHAINMANFQLPMAHLEDKGNTNFSSRLVYATTNRRKFQLQSIYSSEAFTRRFRVSYIQIPRTDFCTEATKNSDHWDRVIDKKYFKGSEMRTDLCEFYPYDFYSGKIVGAPISLESLVDDIIASYRQVYSHGERNLAWLEAGKLAAMKKYTDYEDPKPEPRKNSFISSIMAQGGGGLPSPAPSNRRLPDDYAEVMGMDEEEFVVYQNEVLARYREGPKKTRFSLPTFHIWKDVKELLAPVKESGKGFLDYLSENKVLSGFIAAATTAAAVWMLCRETILPHSEVKSKRHTGKKVVRTKVGKNVKGSVNWHKNTLSAQALFTTNVRSFVDKVYRRNMYIIECKDVRIGTILMVKGRVGFVPIHFVDMIREMADAGHHSDSEPILKFTKCGAPDAFFSASIDQIQTVCYTDELDFAAMLLPRHAPACCDISKFFRTKPVDPSDYVKGMLSVPSETMHQLLYSDLEVMEDIEYHGYYIGSGFSYNLPMKRGDCGSVLYMADSRATTPEILGIHTAGDSSRGFAIFIDAGMVDDMLAAFPTQISVPQENSTMLSETRPHPIPMILRDQVLTVGDPTVPIVETIVAQAGLKQNDLEYLPRPSIPIQTSIRKSVLYGAWKEPTCKPAHLRSFTNDEGVVIDPWVRARNKYSNPCPSVNSELLEGCTNEYVSTFLKCKERPWKPKIFNFEQACEGIEGVPFCDSLTRKTSAGYPYTLHTKKRGKFDFFGEDDKFNYTSNECHALRGDVENIIENAKRGIRTPGIYTDYLKDERKPIAKVDQGKSRLISAMSVAHSIAARMYFLDVVRHSMENRIDNGMAMGVNPYSEEWSYLARKLISKGDRVFAGDFSNFDGSESCVLMYKVLQVVEAYYDNSTEEDRLVREVLFEEITNSYHITGEGLVYEWFGSVPSGTFLTTFTNCVVNNIAIRYCICSCYITSIGENVMTSTAKVWWRVLSNLHANVYIITFGDDNAVGVSDEYGKYVTQPAMTDAFLLLNMIYTDEAKNAATVDHRSLEDITFLKRGFKYDPRERAFLSPLELDVILETPFWTKKSAPAGSVEATFFSQLKELSLHSKEIFDEWSPKMLSAAATHLRYYPPAIDQKILREMIRGEVIFF